MRVFGSDFNPGHPLVRFILRSGSSAGPVHSPVGFIRWSGSSPDRDHPLVGIIPRSGSSPGRDQFSVQISPVRLDDLLVPVETLLPASRHVTFAGVVLVDEDKAVALVHFTGGSGYDVDRRPHFVAEQVDAVFLDSCDHFLNMGAQVIDPIVIVDRSVLLDLVIGAKAVLYDAHRELEAVIEPVERPAQADRVDLPAPVRSLQIRVLDVILVVVVVMRILFGICLYDLPLRSSYLPL